jgi:endonuclease-3
MKPVYIDEFFRRLAATEPEPKTELDYSNAYTLLVAVILSAQATDTGVNKATKTVFKKVQTPAEMLKVLRNS